MYFTNLVLDGGDGCGDGAGGYDVDEEDLRDEEEDDRQLTPITFNGEGEVGTLHQVAYYENPGILMIVQSVEDQEGTKLNQQGDLWKKSNSPKYTVVKLYSVL